MCAALFEAKTRAILARLCQRLESNLTRRGTEARQRNSERHASRQRYLCPAAAPCALLLTGGEGHAACELHGLSEKTAFTKGRTRYR